MEKATLARLPPPAIMVLNDDCLEHILRLLPFTDRYHLALTCSRLFSLYHRVSPAMDKRLYFHAFIDMEFADVRQFFMLCGRNVRKIEWELCRYERQEFFELIGNNCLNLNGLIIKKKYVTECNMRKMLSNLNQLQDLQLSDCNLNDESILELLHLTQLKKLDLSQNDQLTGRNMNLLPVAIESLNISLCYKVNSNLLPKICKALPNLRELQTNGIHTTSSSFRKFVSDKSCESLETISIGIRSDDQEYEHIAKLPNIKKVVLHTELGMYTFSQVRSEFLMMLRETNATKLKHFEVRGPNSINSQMAMLIGRLITLQTLILPMNDAIGDPEMEAFCALHNLEKINLACCRNVTNEAVLRLILACPRLKMLHLGGCPNITSNLLSDIVCNLRLETSRKNFIRALPIRIIVNPKARAKLAHKDLDEDIINVNGKDFSING